MSLGFNSGGLITRGFGDSQRIVTRGFGRNFDEGGVYGKRRVSKEYLFPLNSSIKKEIFSRTNISSSISVDKKNLFKVGSSVSKDAQKEISFLYKLNNSLLREIIKEI